MEFYTGRPVTHLPASPSPGGPDDRLSALFITTRHSGRDQDVLPDGPAQYTARRRGTMCALYLVPMATFASEPEKTAVQRSGKQGEKKSSPARYE